MTVRVTTHGDYLIQLTRWPLLFPVNVFLVKEEGQLTLVDTGMSGKTHIVLEHAKSLGAPITRIVLTHSDPDHIGGLDNYRTALPEAELLASEQCARVLAGEITYDKRGNEVNPARPKAPVESRPTGTLQPGDMVGSLRVVAAPGHKPDQIALFDTRDGTLIAGDAFQTRGGLAVAGIIRWTFPFPGLATADKLTALETARTLRALDPSRLAVGHGDPVESPADAMDSAIREAASRLERGAPNAA